MLFATAIRRQGAWLAGLAACAGILSGCGSAPVAHASAGLAASPTSYSCTTSGPGSATGAPSTTEPPIRTVSLEGDTLTLTFVGGTPPFTVTAQSTARFWRPMGPIDLAGSAGVHIVFTGFRGDMINYVGPRSMTSSGPLALHAYNLEDFEGYVGWGVGTSGPACAHVTASGSTLTFHFIPIPASAASA